jgi:hypothetical protein
MQAAKQITTQVQEISSSHLQAKQLYMFANI